ncbi:MAG TPA: potassium transporter TrkG [bacterium]|nr:potassium transporter TrkG [bacterium]HPG84846.1 potassium transporter TrkG [bacterium]
MMKNNSRGELFGLHPLQILSLGYLFFTLLFTGLLMLPAVTVSRQPLSFADALFLSSSGISTTGLATVDPGSHLTLLGQLVLLLDFQIGGIGYMVFFVMLWSLMRRRLSIREKMVGEESMAGVAKGGTRPFFFQVLFFTLFFEVIGGVLLGLCFLDPASPGRSFYSGLFHSISAFCTAGFSLYSDSLTRYRYDVPVNLIINLLSLAGGIGFIVMSDFIRLVRNRRSEGFWRKLSLHSRLSLIITAVMVIGATALIMFAKGWQEHSWSRRILLASFQVISASTTDGYNTIDIGAMPPVTLAVIIVLMFVGASPGSTGGGVKTTTLGIVLLATWAQLKGQSECNVFGRRIASGDIAKSFSIIFIALMIFFLVSFILCLTEKGSLLQICFETMSALGNTGLSMGITSGLSAFAKILLSLTMFIGRVGPLTIGMAFLEVKQPVKIRYAAEEVYVG